MMAINVDELQIRFLRDAVHWRIQNLEWGINSQKYDGRRLEKMLTEKYALLNIEKALFFET